MKPETKIVYQGKMFEIINWEGKPGVTFEAAVRSPGVRLLIEVEKNDEKALLMTREKRREAVGVDYRLPGGKVFNTLEEYNTFRDTDNAEGILVQAQATAMKEGKEEAGIEGGDIAYIGISKAGASVDWDLYYFLVTNATLGEQDIQMHENEVDDIEGTVVLSPQELFAKLTSGEIQEGRSADMIWKWLAENNFITLSQ